MEALVLNTYMYFALHMWSHWAVTISINSEKALKMLKYQIFRQDIKIKQIHP